MQYCQHAHVRGSFDTRAVYAIKNMKLLLLSLTMTYTPAFLFTESELSLFNNVLKVDMAC